jgi:hypothetical protein
LTILTAFIIPVTRPVDADSEYINFLDQKCGLKKCNTDGLLVVAEVCMYHVVTVAGKGLPVNRMGCVIARDV